MKSQTDASYFGLEDTRDIYPSADANPVSDTGALPAVEIAVESIPHTAESGNRQKTINLPHQAGFQFRDSFSFAHD
jgi:hypothetical protein